jgi:hypothetical protein
MPLNDLHSLFKSRFGRRSCGLENNNFRIETFDDATFFIEDLFHKSFGHLPPTFPINYVAFFKAKPSVFRAIGYIHMSECGDYGLVGGLCVELDYRHKKLGEMLLRNVEKDIGEKKPFLFMQIILP